MTVIFRNRIGTPGIDNTGSFSVFELMIGVPVNKVPDFCYYT